MKQRADAIDGSAVEARSNCGIVGPRRDIGVLYDGERRPSSEVAKISAENTLVDFIDGVDGEGSDSITYELLSGVRVALLRFNMRNCGRDTEAWPGANVGMR